MPAPVGQKADAKLCRRHHARVNIADDEAGIGRRAKLRATSAPLVRRLFDAKRLLNFRAAIGRLVSKAASAVERCHTRCRTNAARFHS